MDVVRLVIVMVTGALGNPQLSRSLEQEVLSILKSYFFIFKDFLNIRALHCLYIFVYDLQ